MVNDESTGRGRELDRIGEHAERIRALDRPRHLAGRLAVVVLVAVWTRRGG
jgi:hypothetical protein